MTVLTSIAQLEAIYGHPQETSLAKEMVSIGHHYRAMIEASPFAAMATVGPEGLDCSPRGDVPGFVRVADEKTLLLPDRRGNNRIDSLRNIIRDPRVALMFLIPGSRNALRVNGRAHLTTDQHILSSFAVEDKAPRCVIVIAVEAVYFQCGRAIIRSRLWDKSAQVDPSSLPTPGQILAELSGNRVGGDDYDRAWDGRAKETMW